MLTSVQIKALKKMNASKDAQKSKIRLSDDFKAASNETKTSIIDLSGQTRSSFYRTFETGSASLKTILSISQILDVSPYYYSGAEDDKGTFSEETLFKFLKEYGCYDLVAELRATGNRKKRKTKKVDYDQISEKTEESVEENIEEILQDFYEEDVEQTAISPTDSDKMQKAITALDEESAVLLLKALFKRAEAGGNAEELCNAVKRCLLS